jgi:hypothetical protein
LIKLLAPQVGSAELAGWRSELALLNAAVEPLREVRNRYLAGNVRLANNATCANHTVQIASRLSAEP